MAAHGPGARPTTPELRPAGRTRAPDRPKERSKDRSAPDRDDRADDRSQGARQSKRSGGRRDTGTEPRSIAEWSTLAVSSLIVLGLIGLTSYFYLISSTAPATVEVEPRLSETYQAGGRFYLPVMVRNTGGETGEEVRVRVTVTDASGRQETAYLMVQFLAGGGSSRAVVAFGSDPRQGQIDAGVVSYLEP
jgi:uncharacterized protein (TIGR02588 family)